MKEAADALISPYKKPVWETGPTNSSAGAAGLFGETGPEYAEPIFVFMGPASKK